MKLLSIESKSVHAGRDEFGDLGVHAPPLDLSSTYPIAELEPATASLDSMADGGPPLGNPIYARLHNPTVGRFEQALAELEGADAAVAFASGMAALTAALLAAAQRGRHVVAIRPLYGGSDHLLASELLGLKVTWTTPQELESAIRDDTSLVIVETPANPTLDLVDIRQLVQKAHGVPVLVDSTFATPVLQRPIAHGASLVLHSATKFLGGHGDIVGGVIATNEEWTRELRRVRVATGALLHPLAGYLLHRGLQTLPVRVRGAQSGAQFLADKLAKHPKVSRVFYPGLADCDPLGVVRRQMRGPGALLAFEVRGGLETADRVMQSVELITSAVSLGSVDTLIQHPAGLTHRVVDPKARASKGITDGLLRLSVGLESPDDLWHDLSRALDESSKSLKRRACPLVHAASE